MMTNSKKMSKKDIKALSNQVRVRGYGQVRLGQAYAPNFTEMEKIYWCNNFR